MPLYYRVHISSIHGFTAIEHEASFKTMSEARDDIANRMRAEYKRYKDAGTELDEDVLQNIVNHSFVIKTNDRSYK